MELQPFPPLLQLAISESSGYYCSPCSLFALHQCSKCTLLKPMSDSHLFCLAAIYQGSAHTLLNQKLNPKSRLVEFIVLSSYCIFIRLVRLRAILNTKCSNHVRVWTFKDNAVLNEKWMPVSCLFSPGSSLLTIHPICKAGHVLKLFCWLHNHFLQEQGWGHMELVLIKKFESR